ncbi:hypothetical protein [Candidatus Uabimicrobium amorphum]|uniref:Uncharacterized protein n=1 Tax=Uabimicrobium amorphum TaxID=2596890 RepID=A0A5S9IS26_UABAM|nr:hypothetical protein [Candidatus Uabimicrobium amorphum]BBM86874.1 hypothetical protein UABAM_05276 [Candidatus Uabimicrobium amorphum]
MEHQISTTKATDFFYIFRHYPYPNALELCRNNKIKGRYGTSMWQDIKNVIGFSAFALIFFIFLNHSVEWDPVTYIFLLPFLGTIGLLAVISLFFLSLAMQKVTRLYKYGTTFLHLKKAPIYFRNSIEGDIEFAGRNFTDLTVCLRYVNRLGTILYEDKLVLKDVFSRQSFSFKMPEEKFDDILYPPNANWQIEAYSEGHFSNFRATYFLPIEYKTVEEQEQQEQQEQQKSEKEQTSQSYYSNGFQHTVDHRAVSSRSSMHKSLCLQEDKTNISFAAGIIFLLGFAWTLLTILNLTTSNLSVNLLRFIAIVIYFILPVGLMVIAKTLYEYSKYHGVFGKNGEVKPWTEKGVEALPISLMDHLYDFIGIWISTLCIFSAKKNVFIILTASIFLLFFVVKTAYRYKRNCSKKTYLHFPCYPFQCGEEMNLLWECEKLYSIAEINFFLECVEETIVEKIDSNGDVKQSLLKSRVYLDHFTMLNAHKHTEAIPLNFTLPKEELEVMFQELRCRYWQLKVKVKTKTGTRFEGRYLLPILS